MWAKSRRQETSAVSWVRLEGWAAGLLGARAREVLGTGQTPLGQLSPIVDGELRGAAGGRRGQKA